MTYLFGRNYGERGLGRYRDVRGLSVFLPLDRPSEGLEDAHMVSMTVSRHVSRHTVGFVEVRRVG